MTVQKRSRIFEIIIAILMIRPSLLIIQELYSCQNAETVEAALKLAFPSFFATVALAIVIITRKYDQTWSKLLVISSLAANFCTDNNLRYVKNLSFYISASIRDVSVLYNFLFGTLLFVLGITAGIVLVLTMFGKIKWKKRNSLLIYAYVMTGIMVTEALILKFHNIYYVELVLMTCLIYELQEKSDLKAVAGWAGTLAAAISDIFFDFYFNYYINKVQSSSDGGFLDYLNYSNSAAKYESIRSLIFAAAIILIPLILFERKEKLERIVTPADVDDDEENDNGDDND